MSPDPFGTAALRAAALDAWRASPARLREDANVEEDHARGYYRDRVVVELAQNAADAAARAGAPGRLLLRLARVEGGGPPGGPVTVLVAANTGAPLDEAGVASLATMRASAKRDGGLVGRYGVGFAAVRAVADEVSVLSTSGAVRFSLRDTAELLAEAGSGVPALAEEVRRRDGSLPALRLPLATDGEPPGGYDTAVVLELRDEVAADEVRALLRDVDDPLLLALPALAEVRVEDLTGPEPQVRVLADVERRWLVARAEGTVPDVLLAHRPVEERAADRWQVAWALRRDGRVDLTEHVVHAPTPTDEHCALPPLLVATLPLDPTRRRVATGALTDFLLDHAAAVYVQLAQLVAREGGDALALVPLGLPGGAVDSVLRTRVVDRLAHAPLLPAADDPARLVAPARAVAVEGTAGRDAAALVELGRRVSSLVRVPAGRDGQARTVGVEVRALADLVEELPAVAG
ncbi:sacsin N-terminal ATP-binding-like domain-containing protein, partial [Cellulomonas massiliensis]|uniref:sacsin N-terminal ATP-binding-like domain-containing protein n=1 Tax=Cellulomonas massiliensis TaxID=1465811 RepID=UPI003526BF8E